MRDPQFSTWPEEKVQLGKLLQASPGDLAIEIGCFRGVTSLYLAQICRELKKKLVCIDVWDMRQDRSDDSVYYYFLETIEPVKDSVIILKSPSEIAVNKLPPGEVGFVFVDGDHSFEGAYRDLTNYWKVLREGGVMAIHDVLDTKGWDGVGKAFDTFLQPGMTAHYLKYLPKKEEIRDYQHGISGLGWVVK